MNLRSNHALRMLSKAPVAPREAMKKYWDSLMPGTLTDDKALTLLRDELIEDRKDHAAARE